MKISKIGAALTAAAIAYGATSARAQVDMTGAGEILSGIRALKAQNIQGPAKKAAPAPKAPAAVQPPSAPDASWQKILEAVKKSGKYTPEKPPRAPGMFVIEDVGGDKTADHTAESVTVFGLLNDDGQFEAAGAGFMSDEWKKGPDGNWHVDRWIFQTDIYGTVEDAAHVQLILTPDEKPAGIKELPLKPTDPAIGQKFQAIIAHWAAPRP